MANPEHVALLKESVAIWNSWREEHPEAVPDLAKAELRYADLNNAKLHRADLRGADLIDAGLNGADLSHADLSDADLIGADLSDANLSGADLSDVDLTSANLGRAYLRRAELFDADLIRVKLSGADLTECHVGWTVFADLDLREAKGLDQAVHHGPSTVGIDTLYRSQGEIPEAFLRGCGFRDWEIEFAKLHRRALNAFEITDVCYRIQELRAGQPLQYHSCFISYATSDQKFADQLYDDLQGRGVRCWFAPHNMRPGRKAHEQIREAIQFHDKLLLILSPASIASEWVKEEILNAWTREKRESRAMLFPISLVGFTELRSWKCMDGDTGRDVAREIREYFIPNFNAWESNPDAYKQGFDKVVASLTPKPTA